MAKIATGFLRQKCWWQRRAIELEANAFGEKPYADAVEIRCRWELKNGWLHGSMGDGTAKPYRHKILVDALVCAGDILALIDPVDGHEASGKVVEISSIVNAAGDEEGRVCYV